MEVVSTLICAAWIIPGGRALSGAAAGGGAAVSFFLLKSPLASLRQLRDAGVSVQAAVRGAARHELRDVGALVYYLRVVGWAIPGMFAWNFGWSCTDTTLKVYCLEN